MNSSSVRNVLLVLFRAISSQDVVELVSFFFFFVLFRAVVTDLKIVLL